LKIESVEAFPVRVKMEEDLRGGSFAYEDYQAVVVKAVCDGVEGLGEAMSRSDPRVGARLVEYLGRSLVGKEVGSPSEAWEGIWRALRVRGHTRGTDMEALSGIDISLFDCLGKLKGKSVSSILSESASSSVHAIGGSVMESRGPLSRQAEFVKSQGLIGTKVKVGFGAEKDSQILAAVRKTWGDGKLVADANGAYDGRMALKVCSAIEAHDPAWFEEPVLSDDWEGYRLLKGSHVKIGGGEAWFAGDFETAIGEGYVGVLEPSVSRCGGVTAMLKAAMEASSRGVEFSPMTGMNSGISLAASLQVAAASKAVAVEFNPFPNPLQDKMVQGVERPKDGRLRVPSKPGLGVEVDWGFVRRHAVG
jgi:L-alanine-DL-glutamate epimerase-like enolase superfamily enzyme